MMNFHAHKDFIVTEVSRWERPVVGISHATRESFYRSFVLDQGD